MSLDKAIIHGKEHREPYRGMKAIDKSCRNHGSDDYAKNNRLHKDKAQRAVAKEEIFNAQCSNSEVYYDEEVD